MWIGKNKKAATEEGLVNIGADETFLGKKWVEEMEIQTKRDPCEDIVRLADGTRKALRYQAEGKLTNEKDLGQPIKVWITELGRRDMIIERD